MTTTFQSGSTIIAPSYYHNILRNELLQNKKGMTSVQIASLSNYLIQKSTIENEALPILLCKYKEALTSLLPQLTIYRSIALTPQFLKECYQMLEYCKLFAIDVTMLPEEDDAKKELKQILGKLFPLPHAIDCTLQALQIIQDASNIYLMDMASTWSEEYLYQKLIEKGAILLPFPITKPTTAYYHAMNKRQEVEAVAQMITQKQLHADDIMLTLCDASYKPLLQQVFQRYQIPFTLFHQTKSSTALQDVCRMLRYVEKPEKDTWLDLLASSTFVFDNQTVLYEYVQIFHADIHIPFTHLKNQTNKSHVINDKDFQHLIEMQEEAEQARQQFLNALKPLTTNTYQEIFTYILKTASIKHQKEMSMLLHIHGILQDILPYIHNADDISFAISLLEELKTTLTLDRYEGVYVKDLNQLLPYRPYHFILGASQNNFPSFSPLKGIFDEAYVETLPIYTMEKRYQLRLAYTKKHLYCCDHLIVSYPLGTYEGKSNESSLEMEQELHKKALPFPLVHNYLPIEHNIQLEETTAKKLFLRDGQLYGSISAFERYMRCPYSYFLRYGLGIQEPMEHNATTAAIGTLSHYVLETLVQLHGKSYVTTATEEITQILNEEISHIQAIYPNDQAMYEVLKHRLLSTIVQRFATLKDFEEHSIFQPLKQEYSFLYEIPLENDITIALKGFIDRIDAYSNKALILDYKSSAKQLSEDKVIAGLQLQLLTYAIVVQKELGKDISGAYYISLKNEDIISKAGELSRIKKEYTPFYKEQNDALILKKHRLQGWTMSENIDELDDNGSHIVGVSMNKAEEVKARTVYDIEKIKDLFQEIFQLIAKRILKGNIALRPIQDACMFCKYHSICRFQGNFATPTPLFEEVNLKKEKGEE